MRRSRRSDAVRTGGRAEAFRSRACGGCLGGMPTSGRCDHREPRWLPDGSGLLLSSDHGGDSYG